MGRKRNFTVMVGDFETVVLPGEELYTQTETSVWSAAYDYVYFDNPDICGDIDTFITRLIKVKQNIRMYFHNLKFDGSFIIDYLLKNEWHYTSLHDSKMPPKTFKSLISDKNMFYSITLKTPYSVIEFWDSAKLVPFTLKEAGDAFETKHRKLEMKYEGYRYPNCKITPQEYQYILNDILCLKEIVRYMLDNGHDKMTIGSCCLKEFKELYDKYEFNAYFPELNKAQCELYPEWSIDTYIRKTYRGAWCYCHKTGLIGAGNTFDINSLYPFCLHSSSGTYYPVGFPHFFTESIPDICDKKDIVWFVHVKCRFDLKDGMLPTVQIKNSYLYKSNEWLKSSKIYKNGVYNSEIIGKDGEIITDHVELFLTHFDYVLLLKHYNVRDLEIIDGCWFTGMLGLFDEYIDKWNYKKENAKTKVERTESKLFNNNLYGKLAMSDNSSYMKPYLLYEVVHYDLVEEHNRDVFSIPCGSICTAAARYYTITHAQDNYEYFCYADTDSLHLEEGDYKNIIIDPAKLGCWKHETHWSSAYFYRQKTYCEFIREENGEKTTPHWSLTCAGLSERGKKLFFSTRPITAFKPGLHLKRANLKPKRVKGGILLVPGDYTFKLK